MPRRSKIGPASWEGVRLAYGQVFDVSWKGVALQGGVDHFRSDTGRVAAGDSNPHLGYERILMYAFWRRVSSQRCWAFVRSC